MKIAFLVQRANFYRLYAPIVDEALRQGWDVECWHDYSQARHGQKGYNFPGVESAPRFVSGTPRFRTYQALPELRGLQNSTDAVVSLSPRPFEPDASRSSVTWFMLQHALQGWCPPLPVLRRMGVRTAAEIHQEIIALRILRGDFLERVEYPENALASARMWT